MENSGLTNEQALELITHLKIEAIDKAKEMGGNAVDGLVALIIAGEHALKVAEVMRALGPEAVNALGELVLKAEGRSTVDEAEEILRGAEGGAD